MRVRAVVLVSVLLQSLTGLFLAPTASATIADHLLISEVQTGSSASATEEFVELYNPAASDIGLTGYTLEYHAASNTDCTTGWVVKARLAGSIKSHGFYLITSKDYLAGDITSTTSAGVPTTLGLATDGNLRLRDASDPKQTIDALAWGKGTCGETAAADAPKAGQSLERRPGADAETGGNSEDTDNNEADFVLRATPGPQSIASPTEEPVDADSIVHATPAGSATTTDTGAVSASAFPVELNELLPDPASPLTDAADEFIEIYNPNAEPIDLAGYSIKSGPSLGTKHVLASAVVPADGYLALKSGTTKIALSNAGTSVALFDPNGQQLGATITYGKAKPGEAWARIDTRWEWTTEPTPNAANIISEPAVAGAAANSKSGKSAASKTSKSKAAAAKSSKATKAKAEKKSSSKSAPLAAAADTPTGHWLLFALAAITIAYVIYEFRYDLRNFYYRLRGYPGRRAPVGQAAEGR